MPARTRTTYGAPDVGKRISSIVFTKTRESYRSTCSDVTGPGDCKSFSVDRVSRVGSIINGNNDTLWQSYPSDGSTNAWYTNHVVFPSPNLGELAATLLRRTNPSRSSVDAVVTMVEAREIPGLLRESWQIANNRMLKHISSKAFRALKIGAKLNLMIQFGIMPLISDAQKLTMFPGLVDKRVQEIERLRTRGLRRTVPLYNGSASESASIPIMSSYMPVLYAPSDKITTMSIIGHIRWYTNQNYHLDTAGKRHEALKILAGATVDPLTAWELMPWSWLIDYFTNIGDFVSLTRNQLNATHSTPVFSVYTKTEGSHPSMSHDKGRLSITALKVVNEKKSRAFANATLNARTEFLTGKQLSILGSLAITRFL